ncbi:hypothetical protein G3I43_33135 [Streptomyces anulatus]|uniref:Uncharacterized protein n=1 Tax=Streptomyces anulatus TaxID=1892 RepID=A0A6G3T1H0_STRAQ|nr:hypothetical protein [Streptomyces anulatus]NEB88973.1 hypothetical protein [Streptomyces anulatus]
MPLEPAQVPARRAVSPLDHRVEAATGHDIDTLWTYRDRGVLDEPHAHLVDLHRELAQAQTGIVFYLKLLNRLSSGEFEVDAALVTRIARTTDQLEQATGTRAAAAQAVVDALEPIEAASTHDAKVLSTDDQAALLAIAGGAKLHEHLLTGRMSVTAASGSRIPYAKLQRLEGTGLVVRDTDHPVHAGQPVALTEAGRAALFAARRTPTTQRPKAAAPTGAWPSTPTPRR